ncbi:PAS domain-containing protein [Pararoseomonas baculiformis]|uniref:PAS domain-containing protein n=1 Tax=Pararoseomonas baculiformis TaxID=2820812 RepID=UPI001ADEC751|nr:PAS domain-containing protein [Pararoseomonas baculiformis]
MAEARIEGLRDRGGIFAEAVRATRMPMVVTDPSLPGNPIVFANGAFLALSGYGMAEVLGQGPYFMNGPETDPANAVRLREALEQDRDEVVETVQYRKDGSRFVASLFISAFKDEGGRTAHQFLSYLDVTRRVAAEERLLSRERMEAELRESEARYHTLFRAMDEAYAVVEVLRDEGGVWCDFRFLDVNPAFMAHTSMPYPVGRTATDLLGSPNPRWARMYGQVLDTGEALRVQEAEPRLGRIFDLNIFALDRERNRVAVLFTDITARLRAEAALRESEERNAFLVRFSDAVRSLSDPQAVAEIACQLAAEQLGTERAYWAEIDWERREYVIEAAFHLPGVPVVDGRFPLDAWEPFTSFHLAGRPVVVDNTQADERIPPAMKEGYARLAVGADLATPVLVNGRLRCTLAVNERAPRQWTPEEVSAAERHRRTLLGGGGARPGRGDAAGERGAAGVPAEAQRRTAAGWRSG